MKFAKIQWSLVWIWNTKFLTSTGPSAMAQSDKMGTYHLFGYVNEKPAYQHESGLDYLYYAEGKGKIFSNINHEFSNFK